MGNRLNVALALDLSLQHISQLIEMLDVNGYCQNTETLKEARAFEEELLKFARYRKCCHNSFGPTVTVDDVLERGGGLREGPGARRQRVDLAAQEGAGVV